MAKKKMRRGIVFDKATDAAAAEYLRKRDEAKLADLTFDWEACEREMTEIFASIEATFAKLAPADELGRIPKRGLPAPMKKIGLPHFAPAQRLPGNGGVLPQAGSTHPLLNPDVEAKVKAIEYDAKTKGWTDYQLWSPEPVGTDRPRGFEVRVSERVIALPPFRIDHEELPKSDIEMDGRRSVGSFRRIWLSPNPCR